MRSVLTSRSEATQDFRRDADLWIVLERVGDSPVLTEIRCCGFKSLPVANFFCFDPPGDRQLFTMNAMSLEVPPLEQRVRAAAPDAGSYMDRVVQQARFLSPGASS